MIANQLARRVGNKVAGKFEGRGVGQGRLSPCCREAIDQAMLEGCRLELVLTWSNSSWCLRDGEEAGKFRWQSPCTASVVPPHH